MELEYDQYDLEENKMLRVVELFSGVGSQTQALKNIGVEHEVVGIAEIDKYAISSYMQLHGDAPLLGDISKINSLPDAELWTYSFPCQDLSVAGKGAGIKEGTRSGLLFEVERLLQVSNKPKYLLMENVKNLVGKKNKPDFDRWCQKLEELGYKNYWQVLNAKYYGVPQNRERVFMVSILGEHEPYIFPEKEELKIRLKDVLENEVEEKYYLSEEYMNRFLKSKPISSTDIKILGTTVGTGEGTNCRHWVHDSTGIVGALSATDYKQPKQILTAIRLGGVFDEEKTKHQAGSVWDKDCLSPTLDTMQGGHRQPCILIKNAYKQPKQILEPKIIKVDILQQVKVRVNEVNTFELCEFLRKHKNNISNQEIADKLHIPKTKVDHWFRNDSSFAIPDADIWFELKNILKITDSTYDKVITEFEMRDGVFEKSNRCYMVDGLAPTLTTSTEEKILEPKLKLAGTLDIKGMDCIKRVYEADGISPTLTTMEGGNRQPKVLEYCEPFIATSRGRNMENPSDRTLGSPTEQRLEPNSQGISNTITTVQKDNYVVEPKVLSGTLMCNDQNALVTEGFRIRKLTPRECWRLMGWKDEEFNKIQGISNSQLYKQAGNGIVINVLERIFENLFKGE